MTTYNPADFDFDGFAKAVDANFKNMESNGEIFKVDLSGDEVWDTYISSFPEGTNPVFRERTYHDGNYDKNFIRRVGACVTIENGTLRTIWDVSTATWPYNVVAQKLSEKIKSAKIKSIFRISENKVGHEKNNEFTSGIIWTHFVSNVSKPFFSYNAATEIGSYSSAMSVFKRALNEFSEESIQTVLDLITSKSIYRGEEFLNSTSSFKKIFDRYHYIKSTEGEEKAEIYMWSNKPNKIKNSSIGVLIEDISNGVDIEKAVASYEKKVAPENYKRSSSVITPKMVENAFKVINELELEDSLHRRHAKLSDVSVKDVLWVSNDDKSKLKDGGLFSSMMKEAEKPVVSKNAIDISIDDFMKNVAPAATSMSALFKNKNVTNLMSITAPISSDAKRIFKWDNGFAWSYNGNITDSYIRKEVQARGGSVSGVFRFSHSWNHSKRNASLMDLHVFLPGNNHKSGINDSYGSIERVGWNHRNHHRTGGSQDVDYTMPAPVGYIPVENITFPDINKMPEGDYKCKIHNWQFRTPTEGGFKAEIEFGGQIYEYEYDKPLKNKEWIDVATVTLKNGEFTITHHIPCSSSSKNVWNIDTEKLVKITTIVQSPNYWEGSSTGNKHWFFLLENCKNPEKTRGIYNEFLRDEFVPHRKVFEILANKTQCEISDEQLSGIGFSSTKKETLTVVVKTDTTKKTYNINF